MVQAISSHQQQMKNEKNTNEIVYTKRKHFKDNEYNESNNKKKVEKGASHPLTVNLHSIHWIG